MNNFSTLLKKIENTAKSVFQSEKNVYNKSFVIGQKKGTQNRKHEEQFKTV